jgi:hypothetical protein
MTSGAHTRQLTPIKRIIMVLLVVCTLSAITATTAQATTEGTFWTVGGSKLNTNETREITIKAEGSIKLEAELFGVKGRVTCQSASVEKGAYLSGGVPGASREVFKFGGGCSVENNGSNCKATEPIETKPLRSELILSEGEPGKNPFVLFESKPESGTEFMEVKFTGTCTVNNVVVSGEVLGSVYTDPGASPGNPEMPVETESSRELTSYLLKFPDEPSLIKLWNGSREYFEFKKPGRLTTSEGSGAAGLAGTILVGLVSGIKYAASL